MIKPKELRPGDVVVFGGKVEKEVKIVGECGVLFDTGNTKNLWNQDYLLFDSGLWQIADMDKDAWELAWDEFRSGHSIKSRFKEIWEKYK